MTVKSLKIGPIRYKVDVVEDLHTFSSEWTKTFLNGQIKYDPSLIQVNSAMLPQRQVVTIMHEAIHGILDQSGVEADEQIILALGFGIVDFIQENPAFIQHIWDVKEQADHEQKEGQEKG